MNAGAGIASAATDCTNGNHYLKSSLYCMRCTSRLTLTRAKGHGGTYWYWFCLGRHRGNGCDQPYVDMDLVVDQVQGYWDSMQTFTVDQMSQLRTQFRAQLLEDRADVERQASDCEATVAKLESQRRKLLHLYYAEKIELDLYQQEQSRINQELRRAHDAIEAAAQQVEDLVKTQDQIFELLQRPGTAYRQADDPIKRRLNRAVLKRILVDGGDVVGAHMEKPEPDFAKRYLKRARIALSAPQKPQWQDTEDSALVFVGPGSSMGILVGPITLNANPVSHLLSCLFSRLSGATEEKIQVSARGSVNEILDITERIRNSDPLL